MTTTRAIYSVVCFGGYFFTASKLLKSLGTHFCCRDSCADFLRLPQASLTVHSFCTTGKRFCVAGRDILAESGFSENVANLKLAKRCLR
jgi:hypothetical protein